MIKVYIASPYTIGDVSDNVGNSIKVASRLIDLGFAPFWPLHSHFLDMHYPKEYETWIKLDLAWLDSCDCLLRLEGKSAGADREVDHAKMERIPIFYSVDEIYEHYL